MIIQATFLTCVAAAPFCKPLAEPQQEGCFLILQEWHRRGLTDLRWLAYMLATAYWETGQTMQPIREYGRGMGRPYGIPDVRTGETYYGRGLVQLTWYDNYVTMTRLVGSRFGADLVRDPDKALVPEIAVNIMFEGMLRADSSCGDFTGVALEDYFNDHTCDWVNARRVINGLDHADEIAELGHAFWAAVGGTPYDRILRYGMEGTDVRLAQSALAAQGHYPTDDVDGDFGRITQKSVIAFQRNKVIGIDGEIGPETRRALGIS